MVERAAQPNISVVRRRLLSVARSMTTPLLPDDYLGLLDPRWNAREATGTIERVKRETPDTTTVVVRPSYPFAPHEPGQYLRIGAEIDGRRHWRAYSLTSDPGHPEGLVSVTVKHVPEGRMSPWFTQKVSPGTIVFLGEVEGTFTLPDPLPQRMLFITAGSGITPAWSMLRELERRGAMDDVVHLHSAPTVDDVIFGEHLHAMEAAHPGYRLHHQATSDEGRIVAEHFDDLCPDWRDRATFLSGPREMIDMVQDHWKAAGDPDQLLTERFQPVIGTGDADIGSGGTVRFRVTDVDATCDVGVSILVGGEAAGADLPYGCRMGICHTCVGKLRTGRVRDLRTGQTHEAEGQTVRTCVHAPEGHVEIEL